MAYKPSPNLSFSSLIRYLTPRHVPHLQTLHLTNVSSEGEPRHSLIYHYITGFIKINCSATQSAGEVLARQYFFIYVDLLSYFQVESETIPTSFYHRNVESTKTRTKTSVNNQSFSNYSHSVSTKRRRDHFVYIKIEKTGSSTLSNIFSSYGYRHQLNMMMSTVRGEIINKYW